MSEWDGAHRRNIFYGHTFELDNKDFTELASQPVKLRVPLKHRKTAGLFNKKYTKRKKRLSERLRKNTFRAFHDMADDDITSQRTWFSHYKISDKNSGSRGIFNNIKYTKLSEYRFQVGQYHYYTYYLLHGNRSNNNDDFIYPTRAFSVTGGLLHGIEAYSDMRMTHRLPKLKTEPLGNKKYIYRKRVYTYDSRGNYLKSSYDELKPWVRSMFKHSLFTASYD